MAHPSEHLRLTGPVTTGQGSGVGASPLTHPDASGVQGQPPAPEPLESSGPSLCLGFSQSVSVPGLVQSMWFEDCGKEPMALAGGPDSFLHHPYYKVGGSWMADSDGALAEGQGAGRAHNLPTITSR